MGQSGSTKMWEVSEDVGKEKSKLHTGSSQQELDALQNMQVNLVNLEQSDRS